MRASAMVSELAPLVLYPDLLLECEDFVLQICDDPFEAKLRANYEVSQYLNPPLGM